MQTSQRRVTGTHNLLKEHGLKATPQRIKIYDKMSELGHACAETVFQSIHEEFPRLTIATVYNVLESFVAKGLVKRRMSSTSKMFFDINTFPHCHLYCRETDSYTDYYDRDLNEMVTEYLKGKKIRNFNWTDIDIQIIGTAKNKNKNKKTISTK